MTLLQIKIAMETYFNTNYTTTAIHYAGTNFDTSIHTEWIYFEYIGSTIADSGLDNAVYSHRGYIKLVAMAETAYRATEIADIALALFKGKKVSDMYPNEMLLTAQGYDKTLNKSYIELELNMTTY
jgi:hypothetical protein